MSEDMRKEMAGLKVEMGALNGRLASVEERLDSGFAEQRLINRRIIATLVRLEGKVDDLSERMATKDDMSAVNARIDGLCGRIDDMDFRWANHEERITALEKRRS